MEFTSPPEQGTKGDGFRIQVKENPIAVKSDSVVKGLADSSMTFSLRYGSDAPITIEKIKSEAGTFNSEELQYAKAGDLQVEGLLEGKLVAQKSVENGDPIISHYNVKARTFRTVKVQEGIFYSMVLPVGAWAAAIIQSPGISGFDSCFRSTTQDQSVRGSGANRHSYDSIGARQEELDTLTLARCAVDQHRRSRINGRYNRCDFHGGRAGTGNGNRSWFGWSISHCPNRTLERFSE